MKVLQSPPQYHTLIFSWYLLQSTSVVSKLNVVQCFCVKQLDMYDPLDDLWPFIMQVKIQGWYNNLLLGCYQVYSTTLDHIHVSVGMVTISTVVRANIWGMLWSQYTEKGPVDPMPKFLPVRSSSSGTLPTKIIHMQCIVLTEYQTTRKPAFHFMPWVRILLQHCLAQTSSERSSLLAKSDKLNKICTTLWFITTADQMPAATCSHEYSVKNKSIDIPPTIWPIDWSFSTLLGHQNVHYIKRKWCVTL